MLLGKESAPPVKICTGILKIGDTVAVAAGP
jgi:hypothetical protein